QQMRDALHNDAEVPDAVKAIVEQVRQLQTIPKDYFPKTLTELKDKHQNLWQQTTRIGLVYGG
ncbi:MAG TPA: hypothetical protein DDW51_07220, partial [Cyanobacteria bacterium UBA11367]|nr:hypothetical protein [Cyanobacteria bacterium UBA11367]